MDYVGYSLISAFIACVLTALLLPIDQAASRLGWVDPAQLEHITWLQIFINFIEFTPLMFIMGMQIMVTIAEKYKIFQWVAVKSLHLTKGNQVYMSDQISVPVTNTHNHSLSTYV